jgi:phosphatidylcholine synthase
MNSDSSIKNAVRAGYALHVATASGAVAGMLALQAVIDGRWRAALLWLIFCQVLDGLDGPIAKRIDINIHAPKIDGHILDLVVDYITCVLVPIALLIQLGLLPKGFQTLVAGAIFLSSALWFARTDLETDDHWFNGFPAVWNLAVPTFLIMDMSSRTVLIVSSILCISQLTNFKMPHLVRVVKLRWLTLPLAVIYLVNLAILSWDFKPLAVKHYDTIEYIILMGFPVYLFLISVWRTWFPKLKLPIIGGITA